LSLEVLHDVLDEDVAGRRVREIPDGEQSFAIELKPTPRA
jgi:hypothetical protein